VVTFARDNAGQGFVQGQEYRVACIGRDGNGRQIVRLVDEHGRLLRWDPRLGSARLVNVFAKPEDRQLTAGDRIQWRIATKDLDLKNAERGTVEKMDGPVATIRWDRGDRVQQVDLSRFRTWDHGYAETVYSAQSKTYDRVYVLAPVRSGLVNGQNYYTAITRARFGVKLWTENVRQLSEKLTRNSGEKTSALEGLGRLERDSARALGRRHAAALRSAREQQEKLRQERRDRQVERRLVRTGPSGPLMEIAAKMLPLAERMDHILRAILERGQPGSRETSPKVSTRSQPPVRPVEPSRGPER